MHQDSFRSVVCRSLSKSLPSRSKDGIGSYPEKAQSATPCVVTLQPTLCQGCQSQDRRQSNREERCMSLHRDYLMASSLSTHFAEDLLRGAMDLQESLAMLEKFQTASHSMREQLNKRRPRAGEKSPDIIRIREALLGASNTKKAIPVSIGNEYDGQLRNSADELKRVIKDSLYRKNLFSASSNDEQASLNQLSRPTPNNSAISKSIKQKKVVPKSISCTPVQPDRSNSPSLVARLMGLDGFSTHTANTSKKDEVLQTVSLPRAQFDIEMPKSKKTPPHIFGQGSLTATETLLPEELPKHLLGKGSDRNGEAGQEAMDTMQFKRLVKTTKNDDHKVQRHNVWMNFPYSQKEILSSCGTSVVNELGSVKYIQREKGIERVRVNKAPEDIKIVSHVIRRQRTEDTAEISKRRNGRQIFHLADRKGEGNKDIKAKTPSTSRTNAKSVIKDDKQLVASSSSPSTWHLMTPTSRKSPNNSRKKLVSSRNVKNATTADIVEYEVHRELIQSDGASTEYSATPSEESCQSADWETEPCNDGIREDFSGYNGGSLPNSPIERTSSTDEDAFCSPTDIPSPKEPEIKDELSLLSDQSFFARAAQLVGIREYSHLIEQYKVVSNAGTKRHDLYIDAATEQLERKHRQQSTGFRPQKCRATPYFSLAALLGDISNGIQKLSTYTDNNNINHTKDGLFVKLEWDLRCTDMGINSAWDMVWQDWVCMEETDQCARDVGEGVLAMLIDELVLDMRVC